MGKARRRKRAHLAIPNLLGEGRTRLDKTQVELAEDLGVTRGTYCTWESGLTLPSPQHRAKLEALFGLEIYPAWVCEFMDRVIREGGPHGARVS